MRARHERTRAGIAHRRARGRARRGPALAARYEQLLPVWKRHLDLEARFPAVAQVMLRLDGLTSRGSRRCSSLPVEAARRKLRTRQLAALFGATEIYLWWTWRTHLGQDESEAEQTMFEILEALVRRWPRGDLRERRP